MLSDMVSHKTFIKAFGGSLSPELHKELFLQCYHIANIHLPLKLKLACLMSALQPGLPEGWQSGWTRC